MSEFNQLAGTVEAYLSDNTGRSERWPIVEREDGGLLVDHRLMRRGFPYEATMAGERVVLVSPADGVVDMYEDGP